jgi:hypothetical protein
VAYLQIYQSVQLLTKVDLNELRAKVKPFASPEAVMEELLEHVFFEWSL